MPEKPGLLAMARKFVADPSDRNKAHLMKAVFDMPINEWPAAFDVEQVYCLAE